MTAVTESSPVKGFVAPDGGWGWVIVIASLLIHLIMDGITYALGQYLNIFVMDFETIYAKASLVHGLLPAITLGCGPIGSYLTDRYGCRMTTLVGSIIAAIGFFLSAFSPNIYIIYVTIGLVSGIGFGLIYVPAIVSVGYYFDKYRSVAMGIAVCGSGIGTIVFAPVNRYLMEEFGWRAGFIIKAGFVLNCVVLAVLMRPLPIEKSEILAKQRRLEKLRKKQIEMGVIDKQGQSEKLLKANEGEKKIKDSLTVPETKISGSNKYLNEGETKSFHGSSMQVYSEAMTMQSNQDLHKGHQSDNNEEQESSQFDLKILGDFVFLFFAVSNFLTSLGFNAPYIFIVDQALSFGFDPHTADLFLQAIGFANMVGRIVLGILSNFKFVNRLYLYAGVISVCGLATIVEPFYNSFGWMLGYSIVFGFTSGGYVSLTALLVVDLMGLKKLSNAFGMLLVFQGVATFIGPFIGGAIRDATENYTLSFMILGSMIMISGLMCFFLPCFRCYRTPEEVNSTEKEQSAVTA